MAAGLVMYLKIVVFIYVYLIKKVKIVNEKKKKFRIETIQKIPPNINRLSI